MAIDPTKIPTIPGEQMSPDITNAIQQGMGDVGRPPNPAQPSDMFASERPTPDIQPTSDEEYRQIVRQLDREIERGNERAERADSMAKNLAEDVDDKERHKIADKVVRTFTADKESRSDWEEQYKDVIDLARMMMQQRVFKSASIKEYVVANVKYPLIATSVIQFSARALPNIIKGREVVKACVIGKDPDGKKQALAQRKATWMNHQILDIMDTWVEDVDKMTILLPLLGCVFKKTGYSLHRGGVVSDLVLPQDFVVNYNAKSHKNRCTHVFTLYPNEVVERMRSGQYLEYELEELGIDSCTDDGLGNETKTDQPEDDDQPMTFLEQHCWYDLDDDGYREPYIITVHRDSRKLMKIVPRFTESRITRNDKNQIVRIDALDYWTKINFMQSFDGSYYGMGFGLLLSPINHVINSTINQLLDAGTMACRAGGFINKTIGGLRGGVLKVRPFEWTKVNTIGDDIRKALLPYPIREPSEVLFKLLGAMLEAGKELSSMSDLLSGNNPPKDQPATTTLALIEQGLKVFSAVFKRIHRGLRNEFRNIETMNELFPPEAEDYLDVVDHEEATIDDLMVVSRDVVPVSDEADLTDTQELLKAEAMLALRNQGLNDVELVKRYLTALHVEDVDTIIPGESWQPQPDPATQVKMQELQLKERELSLKEADQEAKNAKVQAEIEEIKARTMKVFAEIEMLGKKDALEKYKVDVGATSKALSDDTKLRIAKMKPAPQKKETE